jgi:hypothetical protein
MVEDVGKVTAAHSEVQPNEETGGGECSDHEGDGSCTIRCSEHGQRTGGEHRADDVFGDPGVGSVERRRPSVHNARQCSEDAMASETAASAMRMLIVRMKERRPADGIGLIVASFTGRRGGAR